MTTRPLRGRRLAIRLAACAVIGAVLTVGVAWAETFHLIPLKRPARDPAVSKGGQWPRPAPADWPPPQTVNDFTDLLWYQADVISDGKHTYVACRFRQGFPADALEGVSMRESHTPFVGPTVQPVWIKTWGLMDWAIPLTPLWPGFALDTVFYAVIAFALWSAPAMSGVARRRPPPRPRPMSRPRPRPQRRADRGLTGVWRWTTRILRGRKVAIRLAASVVLGAVVTVVVAWTCVLRPCSADSTPRIRRHWSQQPPAQWPALFGPQPWPAAPDGVSEAGESGRRVRYESGKSYYMGSAFYWCYMRTEWSGWPAFALRSDLKRMYPHHVDGQLAKPYFAWVGTAPKISAWWDKSARDDRRFGDQVLPGFALDTAFYAAITFTLWSAPAFIRRRTRRARGLCPACGYDLKGAPSPTCPECGA